MTNSLDVVLCQPYLDKKGGAERVVLEIARHFNAPIYTLRYSEKNTFEGFGELEIRTIKTGFVSSIAGAAAGFDRDSRAGELASAGPALFSHKIKDDYDALSAHLPPSEWLRNKNERMCWYCHGTNAGFLRKETLLQASLGSRNIAEKALFYAGTSAFRAVEKEIVGKIEKICACSEITAKRIGDSFGRFDAEPIHPAVDYKKFGCGSFQKYFLCLSRMVPEKGLDAAINAFRIFSQKRKGWKLIIAGSLLPDSRNRAHFEHLKTIAKGLPVEFAPNIPDTRAKKLYADCSALLFPSADEDWGLVVLEAMASSKPVIANNKGGPTISVVDGKTGFLVNSVEKMAEQMEFLAAHPDECEKMGKAGRKRVEQNYTWRIFLSKMKKAFKETASK